MKHPLLSDLTLYCESANFDPQFIRTGFLFRQQVIKVHDYSSFKLLAALLKQATAHFEKLGLEDAALVCRYSVFLNHSRKENLTIKEHLFLKLDQAIMSSAFQDSLKTHENARKIMINLVRGYAENKLGSQQIWHVLTQQLVELFSKD